MILGIGLFAMFLFLGLYLQVVMGYTPIVAGFAFLPFSVGISRRRRDRQPAAAPGGAAAVDGPRPARRALGLLLLTQISPTPNYFTHVLPAIIIMSVGMAFVFIPMASTALHGIGHQDAGVGSALINTSQQIGGAVGVALLNTVATITTTSYLAAHGALGQAALPNALVAGYTRAFVVGAGFLIAAAVIAALLLNIGKEAAAEADEVPVAVA